MTKQHDAKNSSAGAPESASVFGVRQLREGKKTRFGCGLMIGFVIAIVLLLKWGNRHPVGLLAIVVAVALAIFVAWIFANKSDNEAIDTVEWLVWPEWKIWSVAPDWIYTIIWALLAGAVIYAAWNY